MFIDYYLTRVLYGGEIEPRAPLHGHDLLPFTRRATTHGRCPSPASPVSRFAGNAEKRTVAGEKRRKRLRRWRRRRLRRRQGRPRSVARDAVPHSVNQHTAPDGRCRRSRRHHRRDFLSSPLRCRHSTARSTTLSRPVNYRRNYVARIVEKHGHERDFERFAKGSYRAHTCLYIIFTCMNAC